LDRAGFGLSDVSPKLQTVANTTTDLEAALKAARIDGPYIAVGHSLGGLEALLFKDRQPQNVVGMVLVDPTVPVVVRSAAPPPSTPAAPPPSLQPFPESPAVAFFHKCAAGLRAGTVRKGADPDGCLRGQTLPPEYPPELRAALDKHPEDRPPEEVAKGFDFLAASAAPLSFQEADEISLKPLDGFRRGHDQMAAVSTRGVNRVVEGSSHFIQQIKPQAVIDAIDEVVDEARADMGKAGKTAGR
jgi:pimeloyl-ACP methyl ester carboxylesterase